MIDNEREKFISEVSALMDEVESILEGKPNDAVFSVALSIAEMAIDYDIPDAVEFAVAALRTLTNLIEKGGPGKSDIEFFDTDISAGRTLN